MKQKTLFIVFDGLSFDEKIKIWKIANTIFKIDVVWLGGLK